MQPNNQQPIHQADIDALETGFLEAYAAIDSIDIRDGYPIYPEEIKRFMFSLTGASSIWRNTGYDPSQVKTLFDNIDVASIEDIRSILTGFSRGERFSDGFWISILEDRAFEPIIARLRVIVE